MTPFLRGIRRPEHSHLTGILDIKAIVSQKPDDSGKNILIRLEGTEFLAVKGVRHSGQSHVNKLMADRILFFRSDQDLILFSRLKI